MPIISQTIVDARPHSDSKTSGDRMRFLRRARQQIKEGVKKAISSGGIRSLEKGRIKVPVRGLNEPELGHDPKTGSRDRVYTGNKEWIPGDTIDKPSDGKGSGSGASEDGEGQDEFIFELTPEEFYEFLFDDLALPDMLKRNMKQIVKVKRSRSGFVTQGNPSQLDIKHTYKFAFARHKALGRPTNNDIDQKEIELADASALLNDTELEDAQLEISKMRAKQKSIPLFDNIDLRYRNYPPKPEPITKAVMFLLMDVSGSMDQDRKDLAKRFFLLLYVWLMKQYDSRVELVFIRHHSTAEEVDEQEFFYGRESGGTVVSPALELTSKIIQERYSPNDWNIYVSHASDGDNWAPDNKNVQSSLAQMMPSLQYFAFLQVAERSHYSNGDDLWAAYSTMAIQLENIQCALASKPEDIWPVFKELFQAR